MNGDYERIDQHLDDALAEDAPDRYCLSTPAGDCISTDPRCMHQPTPEHLENEQRTPMQHSRERAHEHHRLFLIPASSPLASLSDVVLSWSQGEWLIIDSHSYHPDFYINWRLRKLVGAVMSGKVYKAIGPDGEVYRVEGWETEHKEQEGRL